MTKYVGWIIRPDRKVKRGWDSWGDPKFWYEVVQCTKIVYTGDGYFRYYGIEQRTGFETKGNSSNCHGPYKSFKTAMGKVRAANALIKEMGHRRRDLYWEEDRKMCQILRAKAKHKPKAETGE